MRLQSIKLFNLRCFEELELELHPQLTLIVGRNGAGKSSILDGIAVALGGWLSGFKSIKEDHYIQKTWPRLVKSEVDGIAIEQPTYPVRVEARGSVSGSDVFWARELRSEGGRTTSGELDQLRNFSLRAEANLSSDTALPLVAYYGTGRLWVQKRDRSSEHGKSRLDGYRAALEAASDQKGFAAWMARLERDRIQRIARAHEEGSSIDAIRTPLLDAVADAACNCLEGAKRFYYSANHEELRVDFVDGLSIPFADLSDGQRNVIALAADLAWRATQLNPQFGHDAPAKAVGVVLIDEVELHLHPAWQRRVLDDLTTTFPGLQFVVATHSPQVMSSAPPGSIRLLDKDHRAHGVSARGKTTNVILEDLMGVAARPVKESRALDELGGLIEDGMLEDARLLLRSLSDGPPGASDPDVVAAAWELDMAERGLEIGAEDGDAPDK